MDLLYSIGATSDNVQEIMMAVNDKMMEMWEMECGGDCEPEKPSFDDMAMFFDGLNLNLQLTQEVYDQMDDAEE
jgi:hypothetical protein